MSAQFQHVIPLSVYCCTTVPDLDPLNTKWHIGYSCPGEHSHKIRFFYAFVYFWSKGPLQEGETNGWYL